MNYATFAALNNYATVTAALAANPANGAAWLLNENKIFQDGRMPKSGPAAVKKDRQKQMATALTPTISRNKGTASAEGYKKSALTDSANKEVVANNKAASIRHKVAWYVTDTSLAAGYRRVFGILEDSTTTSPYRDDDAQVRK
jgi:hypothetical protein